MRIVRHGEPGAERPGVLDPDGVIRDLSDVIPDWGPAQLSADVIAGVAALDRSRLPVVDGTTRLGPPVTGTPNFYAIGLNYAAHAHEIGGDSPAEPLLFSKATSCISGPFDPVVLPPGSTMSDWEAELGIVIGAQSWRVDPQDAAEHIAGYCIVNDVSERDMQANHGGQWIKGKSCPTFGPLGPWLVTRDEVTDPQSLDLWLDLNGERMQDSNTAEMIFGCVEIVSYLSMFLRLLPGDVIATGTPAGIGATLDPPRYLHAGDEMRLGITGLGEQRTAVVAAG